MKANGARPSPSSSLSPGPAAHALPVVILGTDATLAAAPATPVQLAHACLRAGFASVIPGSWGDELIATGVLRRLEHHGPRPAIQCSCPIVAHRLLAVSGDLRHVMVPVVSPPVALARYVRDVSPASTRITYVGTCPGAGDPAIDIRMTPAALLDLLAEREIVPEEQPRVFESILPPDRRRFCSQPGGLPTPEVLWNGPHARSLVEINGDDISSEIAQHLLGGKSILVDVSARLGCVCSGACQDVPANEARSRVVAGEPPRSASPVIDTTVPVELDLPVPAVSRTPADVIAVFATPGTAGRVAVPASPADAPAAHPAGLSRGATPHSDRGTRGNTAPTSAARPIIGGVPVSRDADGRALPRAYVARRRPSPKSTPIVPSLPHPPAMSAVAPMRETTPAKRASKDVQALVASPTALPPIGGERAVPLTATAEPASVAPANVPIAPTTPAPPIEARVEAPIVPALAMTQAQAIATPEPQTVVEPPLETSTPPRASRPVATPRDLAAAERARVAEAGRTTSRMRALQIVLLLAAIVASTAAGVVIGRRIEISARPTTSSP